ncbi:MAG: peptidylprolyl isomerase [Myxococcota bacterium]|nr:peptidylprolyl isomerase [Myxococcota bacterium]
MRKLLQTLTISVLSVSLLHCTKSEEKASDTSAKKAATKKEASKAVTDSPQEAPIELPKIEGPVAVVNGVKIPADQFLVEFGGTLRRYQRARHPVKPQLKERLKDNLVRRLVDAEIIRQKAKEMQVEVLEKDFDAKWEAHKKRYGTADAFEAFLARTGETVERMQAQFRLNLIREQVFAKVSDNVVIQDKDLTDFYEKNKEKYNEKEKIKASHILFRVTANASDEEKKKKKALAKKVLAEAKKAPGSFAELAKKYGEDPTKDRGGDLGFFTKGRMVKPFEEAAWGLKKGKVSNLVTTQFGYHIIMKTDHQKANQKSFKDVKEQISRTVRAQRRNNAVREAISSWRSQAKIEVFVKGDPKIINQARQTPTLNRAGITTPDLQVAPTPKKPKQK